MANVFLSHAASDACIAALLKNQLEERLPSLTVFLSSDPTDLPPGSKWPVEVQKELRDCQFLVLLATTRSMRRPWVWFEAGSVWFDDSKPLIPVCVGEMRKNSLPAPFSERTALAGDDPTDLKTLLKVVGERLAIEVNGGVPSSFTTQLTVLDREVANALANNEGWIGVEWDSRFLAYEGPLEGLRLIEDEVFREPIAEALRNGGYEVRLGASDRLSHAMERGFRLVYLTDRRSWRRKLTKNELVLLAKPKDK